jgi:hypothetical protein
MDATGLRKSRPDSTVPDTRPCGVRATHTRYLPRPKNGRMSPVIVRAGLRGGSG